jgi:hypothetical protein
MNSKNLFKVSTLLVALLFFITSCVKEGPMGLQGEEGAQGKTGANGNESCKVCHNNTVVGPLSAQYHFSKHSDEELPKEEAGNGGCAPCHESEGLKYVIANNIPATFVLNTTTNQYENKYASTNAAAYGAIDCFTCHKNLHTTYALTDFAPLLTVAPVPMTMWGGTKTIDIKPDGGISNLCIRCHQPRPFTNSNTDRNMMDYAALVNTPAGLVYDAAAATTSKLRPSYRTHTHYGTAGAVYAGMGGVEFKGSMGYANMQHTAKASCKDCHMTTFTAVSGGGAGGHSFNAKGNFAGCNTTDCHGAGTVTASNAKYWTNPRAEIKTLLETLAGKLKINGIEILNRNADPETNLWAGLTSGKWDGYLNIYDPSSNPDPLANNTGGAFQSTAASQSSWTQAQKDYNAKLTKLPALTNAQLGAIINFQMVLRDFSMGIHNFDYAKALLTNSIAVLN